jgi:spore maturation protein CgeB
MRIVVVGPSGVDTSEMGCVRGLRALGHTAEICDLSQHLGVPGPLQRYPLAFLVAEYLLRSTVREPFYLAQKALVAQARALRADLVLVVQLLWVLPETVTALREAGVRCVGWFPDAFTSFGRGTFLLAPWDALFFQDRFIVERLSQSLGAANIHHLAQCCDPSLHRPLPLSPADEQRYAADVATYGNYYPYRARLLEPLLAQASRPSGDPERLTLKLWGARPPRWLHHQVRDFWAGQEVSGDEKCRAMRACKIALNTNHYAGIGDVNKRTFELAGIGAFQLTDERAALRDYFLPGQEVATFSGPRELREKVAYYLAHPEERAAIAARGQARAHRDHTFERRLTTLLSTVGLPVIG